MCSFSARHPDITDFEVHGSVNNNNNNNNNSNNNLFLQDHIFN